MIKKEGSKNYVGVDSPVVDFLIEKLIGAKTRHELTTAIHKHNINIRYDIILDNEYFNNDKFCCGLNFTP